MSLNIIGGSLKGKRLVTPAGRFVRPTSGRVREALFNIIGAEVYQAIVLDLFAGSGAMGLEALSRGAAGAVFVDSSAVSLNAIKKNIQACDLSDRTRVVDCDATKELSHLTPPTLSVKNNPDREGETGPKFNLIFLDPPYRQALVLPVLSALHQSRILANGATVVAEHSRYERIATNHYKNSFFQQSDQRRYGKTLVSFMQYIVK
jgi:16S rRNA (guanine966-N2)-methyltransferase